MIALLLASVLYLPPLPPFPTEPPTGALPWPVPSFPAVPTSTAPTISLDEMEHSDDFEDRQETIEGQIEDWIEPITGINGTLGVWIGDDGVLPDASGGDFTVGLTPIDDVGSLYEFADWLGEQIGVLFEYIRVALTFPGEVMSILLTVLLGCATLLLLVKMFIFGLSIFDAAWSFATKIIEILGAFLPTGG